jgi:hypothetical protein
MLLARSVKPHSHDRLGRAYESSAEPVPAQAGDADAIRLHGQDASESPPAVFRPWEPFPDARDRVRGPSPHERPRLCNSPQGKTPAYKDFLIPSDARS